MSHHLTGQPAAGDEVQDVIVVGAGQAGLAVAQQLADRDLDLLVLDAGSDVGEVWRRRWDSLTLFTPAEYCSLPGLAFPARPGTYPTKDQVAAYLSSYAAHFALPVRLDTRVRHLRVRDGLFDLETTRGSFRARQVVVATGPFQAPVVPSLAADLEGHVRQVHSSAYRSADALPGERVLVVGGGNSGLQIALELAASREVGVAFGGKQPMVPQRPLGKDLFWWLSRTGLITLPGTSPVARRLRERGGDLVIGTSMRDLRRAGITTHPRLVGVNGTTVRFEDGSTWEPDTVVWATGFRRDFTWIDVPGAVEGGEPVHDRGRSQVPGLSFIGLPWQWSRGSALLGFVHDDARWLAAQVAADLEGRSPHRPSHVRGRRAG